MPGRSGDAAGLPCSFPAAAAAFLHGGCTPSCLDSETRRPGTSSGPGEHSSPHPAWLHYCPATREDGVQSICHLLMANYLLGAVDSLLHYSTNYIKMQYLSIHKLWQLDLFPYEKGCCATSSNGKCHNILLPKNLLELQNDIK